MMRVLATAGHVDHGKSTLIRVLTGTDPDRWAIEKERGMTIDLGFATMTLASGNEVGFVDVPGHFRFVKKMLAGVASVDACLFVVDANEGWKPQSEEHLRILELLQVRRGVVALTKVADLDEELRDLAALEVAEHLQGTSLADAEIVLVDSLSGEGIPELRVALDRLVLSTPPSEDRGRPRMWVDRAFTIRGAGTVVTGTLVGGRLKVGDDLIVQPGGERTRIRSMESHGRELTESEPGRRLALNLSGVARQNIDRGHAIVKAGQWHETSVVDASLLALSHLDRTLKSKGAYAAYIGTGDYLVRLRVLGQTSEVAPGETGLVRMWLKGRVPLALLPGDRFVLRELGRDETVGGGEILDVDPVLSPARAAPTRSMERVIDERGWLTADELERLTGERIEPTIGRWVMADASRERMEEAIRNSCRDAGGAGVDIATFSDVERALLDVGVVGVTVVRNLAFDEASTSRDMSGRAAGILELLEASPWSPPSFTASDRSSLRELEERGVACRAGDLWFATSALDAAASALAELIARNSEGFTVSEACQALSTSRKYGMPMLSYFDASGLTRRRGDRRVAGPVMLRRQTTEASPED
jgi:selenocysteine-specific elongation factor